MFLVERGAFALFMLRSFLFGALTAAVYLLLGIPRILLGKMKRIPGALFTALLDAAFCLIFTFCALLLVYCSNRGQMRIAAMLFFAAGALSVYLPLSRPVCRAEKKLLRALGARIVYPVGRRLKKENAKLRAFAEKRKKEKTEKRFDRRFDRYFERSVKKSLDGGYAALFGEPRQNDKKKGRPE